MLLIKLFVFVGKKFLNLFHVFCLESIDSESSNLSVFNYFWTVNRKIGSSGWSSMTDPFILWISLSYDFPWPPPDFLWIVKKELHNTLHSSAGVFLVPVFISRFHLAESIFDCLNWVLHSGKVICRSLVLHLDHMHMHRKPWTLLSHWSDWACGLTTCAFRVRSEWKWEWEVEWVWTWVEKLRRESDWESESSLTSESKTFIDFLIWHRFSTKFRSCGKKNVSRWSRFLRSLIFARVHMCIDKK